MDSYKQFKHFFFVGVAGTGMSAIAQYLKGEGKNVSGSDRLFGQGDKMPIQLQLEQLGINCFFQDASGVTADVDCLVISTAIEETNVELKKARQMGITVVKRSELLSSISKEKRTIAIGGTSGKSTTSAMVFHILQKCGFEPSIMSGAGLVSLQQKGLPGNAWNGKSDWLVIESDESDGSIVNYVPEIAIVLNVDRDHKEYAELMDLFGQFKAHTTGPFIVNESHPMARQLSVDSNLNFGTDDSKARFNGSGFRQTGFNIQFDCCGVHFNLPLIGRHNMENALAATAVCAAVGVSVADCATALQSYQGIYRRAQLAGTANGCFVIDDFAHNPAEVVCAIHACQNIGKRVWAWFQPHGFGPMKFMHKELEEEVLKALNPQDYFLLSDVYYAGGTVDRVVTSEDVAAVMQKQNDHVMLFADRNLMLPFLKKNLQQGDVILTMGARDNSLSDFAKEIFEKVVR
jgi:UDP-N-acetylmuramate--alanine ligase